MTVIDEIVRRHPGEPVAMVTHAGVIRAIVAEALGIRGAHAFRFQLKPTSLTIIDYRHVSREGRRDPYLSLLNG
jgi:broad specificity phosphatase PhoE